MSAFVTEMNKLRNRQQNLEKSQHTLIEQFSKVDDSSQIPELYKENKKSRATYEEKLHENAREIMKPLHTMKKLITEENVANLDIKFVKNKMTTIQDNIQKSKSNMKASLEVLEDEEEMFLRELQAFDDRLQEWSKPINNVTSKQSTKKISTVLPENISQEIRDYLQFVALNGGHENGWSSDDHILFLKYRNKFNDLDKFVHKLHALLPDISEAEIMAHEEWYQKYIQLKEKHKTAIKNWRHKKLQRLKSHSPPRSKASSQQNSLFNSISECLNKEEIQRKISQWKSEKFREERERKQKELQKKYTKLEAAVREKERQNKLKAQVENWRSSKTDAEKQEKLQKELEELRIQRDRAARANKLIKQFQNQDKIFIRNKLQSCLTRPRSAEPVRVNVAAIRDPSRLFKPTQQWILRSYGNNNETKKENNFHLQSIPKLGIPEWRKSIN